MNAKISSRPATTLELLPSERRFLDAMHHLGYGRFESVRIEGGKLVLDPWPSTIRYIKFGSFDPGCDKELNAEFRLKCQVAELFEYVRAIETGEIRLLEIRAGLPLTMHINQMPEEGVL